MALGDFLADQSLGSWADEMDAQPLPAAGSGYSARNAQRGAGDSREEGRAMASSAWERSAGGIGGAPSGQRVAGFDRPFATREELPMPDKPPYTAHLGNLAFDVTQADIESFLSGCEVTNIRIVEDKLDHKPKGFGYVEFATVDGLKKALTLTESSFMGRNIRVSVAEPPKERQESNRDFSDWSRKGPLPELPGQGRQPSRTFERRPFEDRSDAGSEVGGGKRPGYFQDDGKVRDFGDWSRKGPLSPTATAAVPAREGRGNPTWGEGRDSDAGSRPPRKEFQERAPTAADQDSQWREKMRADPAPVASPEASTPSSPQVAQAPKERPRLNLTKRTVSDQKSGDAPAAAPQSKASPFGAARPTDTANRDREIAEKREIAIREKREADDKAKEEKAAKDAAAKQARADQDDKTPEGGARRASRQNGPPKNNPWRQNGEQSDKNVSILKRDNETEQEAQRDTPDGDANGEIVADKETKPQEIVQEVTRDAGEGAKQTETTAETLEDEGWSTVSAKPKNSRRGGTRAMAS